MSGTTFLLVAGGVYTVQFVGRVIGGYQRADRMAEVFEYLSADLEADAKGRNYRGVFCNEALTLTPRGPFIHRRRTMTLTFTHLASLARLDFCAERYRRRRSRAQPYFYSWRGDERERAQQVILRSKVGPTWDAMTRWGGVARIRGDGEAQVCVDLYWSAAPLEVAVRRIQRVVHFITAIDALDKELPLVELTPQHAGSTGAPSGNPVPVWGAVERGRGGPKGRA